MKTKSLVSIILALAVVAIMVGLAQAQQTTGVPGSPSATTTIDGRYLPNPPQPFQGEIKLNALQSKPAWPARVVPPKGAPNILLIMTDDVGFGAPSTFGGIIPTPTLDRIAANGLRYPNFHTTSLCSPTRAAPALLAGKHTIAFDFKYDGLGAGTLAYNNVSGVGKGGTGTLKVDGNTVATERMEHTLPLTKPLDTVFNIGDAAGTPLDDKDYKIPFKFTGKIDKITIKLEPPKLTPEDVKKLKEAEAKMSANK